MHGFEPCIAVEGADVVVTALEFDYEDARRVLHGLRTRYASTPLVVLVSPAQRTELDELLQGCLVLDADVPVERVTAAALASLHST